MSRPRVDVLIITALKLELDALRKVAVETAWTKVDEEPPYYTATLTGRNGPVLVAAARTTAMAGVAAAALTSTLAERLQPRVLAMCGVCAGHPEDTDLGDVIIADRVYVHDFGKRNARGLQGDITTHQLTDTWLRAAQDLCGPANGMFGYLEAPGDAGKWWLLEQLLHGRDPLNSSVRSRYISDDDRPLILQGLLASPAYIKLDGQTLSLTEYGRDEVERRKAIHGTTVTARPYHIQVGPVGSGNYVAADGNIWNILENNGMRKIRGVEMEAAAIGQVAHARNLTFVVAKAVMDHADEHKSDGVKDFAARTSAEVLCRFLREVIIPSSPEATTRSTQQPTSTRIEGPPGPGTRVRTAAEAEPDAGSPLFFRAFIERMMWRQRAVRKEPKTRPPGVNLTLGEATFHLSSAKPAVIVGRGEEATLRILVDGVSRRHAKISWINGSVYVEDLGSRFGTKVSGEAVEPGCRREVTPGQSIVVATSEIEMVWDQEAKRTAIARKPTIGPSEGFDVSELFPGGIKDEAPALRGVSSEPTPQPRPLTTAERKLAARRTGPYSTLPLDEQAKHGPTGRGLLRGKVIGSIAQRIATIIPSTKGRPVFIFIGISVFAVLLVAVVFMILSVPPGLPPIVTDSAEGELDDLPMSADLDLPNSAELDDLPISADLAPPISNSSDPCDFNAPLAAAQLPVGDLDSEASGQVCDIVTLDTGIRLIRLTGGEFTMGGGTETRHRVSVTRFEIGETEVSMGQFEAVMGYGPPGCKKPCNPQHPAQGVSWQGAVKFMNELTRIENTAHKGSVQMTVCYDETTWAWDRACTGYRLPTEAEWEFAARAGTKTAYWFGEQLTDKCTNANTSDCKNRSTLTVDVDDVIRVGKNGWGLYGVHGNVTEWVYDTYAPYGISPVANPIIESGGSQRVRRGGSYNLLASAARSHSRVASPPASGTTQSGFRCARGRLPE